MLATVIANISGKSLKRTMKEKDFMPNYLRERTLVATDKTLEQQAREFQEFKQRLRAASPQSVH